jgi:alpha-N-acetylglucosaminidase
MSPPGPVTLSRLHGFSQAAPPGNFIITDMAASGQWKEWKGSWGLPFIWTALPDFGGNLYQHGDLAEINQIPFAAPPLTPGPPSYDPATQVVGVGYTPEGLDQNPAYYELLQEAAFKSSPEPDLTAWLVKRAHRRYGLATRSKSGSPAAATNPDVTAAWTALRNAGYANDGPVHDPTGVANMPARDPPAWMGFAGTTPKPAVCLDWKAWGHLTTFGAALTTAGSGGGGGGEGGGGALPATFTYDLVDVGREALSQLTIPISQNFSRLLNAKPLSAARIQTVGALYVELLVDLDSLLATDAAFLLGSWLASARRLGGNATDCTHTVLGEKLSKCADFMEWNARVQLTTWHPVTSPTHPQPSPEGNKGGSWPGAINDYAKKQWAGLTADYYAARVAQYAEQGVADAKAGHPFDLAAMTSRQAKLAYDWQTAFGEASPYPTEPVGDPVTVSEALRLKYARYFASCV